MTAQRSQLKSASYHYPFAYSFCAMRAQQPGTAAVLRPFAYEAKGETPASACVFERRLSSSTNAGDMYTYRYREHVSRTSIYTAGAFTRRPVETNQPHYV